MEKQKSTAAQAAALIRKELKEQFKGLQFSVKSDPFANGDSVRIEAKDINPTVAKIITKIVNKYQYGAYNSQNDIYENNNENNLPQVKYVTFTHYYSEKLEKIIFNHTEKSFRGSLNDINFKKMGFSSTENYIYQLYTGAIKGFWESLGEETHV